MWALVAAWSACAIGAGMGVKALIDPGWVGRLVRLQPDPAKREGRAELRANYGGIFTAMHVFAALVLWRDPSGVGVWVAASVGVLWLGVGLTRIASFWLDDANTTYNRLGAAFELVMAGALSAPLIAAFRLG